MTTKRDHYTVLGVPKGAGQDSVKKAFRRKARATHPDANGGKGADEFRQVVLAYEVLGDEVRRKRYDETGDDSSQVPNMSAAFAEVARMVAQAVAQFGPGADILERCRTLVLTNMTQHGSSELKCESEAKKFRDAAKRVTRKAGGENLLAQVLEQQAGECDLQSKLCRKEAERLRALLPIIDEYEWKADKMTARRGEGLSVEINVEGFLEAVHGSKWKVYQ